MDIISVYRRFPTEADCIDYLESVRWPNGPACPYCGSSRVTRLKAERRHHCNACNTSFSVTVGTIFHKTHMPLQKWFLAVALTLNAKKGISARQLGRDLEVTKDTAWRIAMKMRTAMAESGQRTLLTGIVECDETFIGPRRPRRHHRGDNTHHPRGRGTPKTPVVGMPERGGDVYTKVIKKKDMNSRNLSALVRRNVDTANAVLYTDKFTGYVGIKTFMPHATVDHAVWYVDGNVHTNGIESFWALLKRGIVGQYHKVSLRYLPACLSEFNYRFNNRHATGDLFDRTVARALGVI